MVLYHASPKEKRASILKHGIDYRKHFGDSLKPANTQEINWATRANYLDQSFQSLSRYFPEYDIWEVDASGYRLRPDAAWFGGWTTRKPIPPERLTFLEFEVDT